MRWERNQQMLGDCMTCMGTCMNGAGTGMAVTRAKRKQIHWARPRGLTVCYAAGAGTILLGACVPRTGSAATARTAGSTILASGLFAPSFGSKQQGAKCPLLPKSEIFYGEKIMKITIKNEQGTGVTIIEVHIQENKKNYTVSIPPTGDSFTIDIPELNSCNIAVSYTNNYPSPKRVGRPSPITDDCSVSLVKSHDEMEPILI